METRCGEALPADCNVGAGRSSRAGRPGRRGIVALRFARLRPASLNDGLVSPGARFLRQCRAPAGPRAARAAGVRAPARRWPAAPVYRRPVAGRPSMAPGRHRLHGACVLRGRHQPAQAGSELGRCPRLRRERVPAAARDGGGALPRLRARRNLGAPGRGGVLDWRRRAHVPARAAAAGSAGRACGGDAGRGLALGGVLTVVRSCPTR